MRRGWLLLILILNGCFYIDHSGISVSNQTTELPQIIYWNKEPLGMENQGNWWLKEAKTRFANPVVLICHGGYEYTWNTKKNEPELVWCVFPDQPNRKSQPVQEVANTLANLYPKCDIILVTCNEHGDLVSVGVLFTKRVWYVPDGVVWMEPNYRGFFSTWYRAFYKGQGYGSIWDFVSYDGRQNPPEPTSQPAK